MTEYGRLEIETEYPFGDNAAVTWTAATTGTITHRQQQDQQPRYLYLRVPGWAVNATISAQWEEEDGSSLIYDGNINGTVQRLRLPSTASAATVLVEFNPQIRLETDGGLPAAGTEEEDGQRATRSYSVHRGALMFSLPLNLTYRQTAHYYAESNDYDVTPTSPWAWALDYAPNATGMRYVHAGYSAGSAPFNKTARPLEAAEASFWPCHIVATARDISGLWRTQSGKSEWQVRL